MSQMTMSVSQPRDALFPSHWAEMLSLQVSIPCQVVKPAHPYACYYIWNSVHLFVRLHGCCRGHADRMSFAPRPMSQHRSADWEKGATKILRAGWCTATELLYLVLSAYHQIDVQTVLFVVNSTIHSLTKICRLDNAFACRWACWKDTIFPNYILLEESFI